VKEKAMPKYMIERDMPGAGALAPDELAAIAERSCQALDEIGPQIQWLESFITADKVYSVYIARDERLVREHAHLSGLPVHTIREVKTIIDPSSARDVRWAREHDVSKEAGIY
jgi:hypothetical protein